ncbi:hypothetical protein, partial [Bacillus paralicheniformis]
MSKYRKAGNVWDRIFRNNYNQNLDDIDSDIKANRSYIDEHKVAKTAHTSKQIEHGGFTVSDRLDNLWA